jgi:hypothetical protein
LAIGCRALTADSIYGIGLVRFAHSRADEIRLTVLVIRYIANAVSEPFAIKRAERAGHIL